MARSASSFGSIGILKLRGAVLIHRQKKHHRTVGKNQHENEYETELQHIVKEWESIPQKEELLRILPETDWLFLQNVETTRAQHHAASESAFSRDAGSTSFAMVVGELPVGIESIQVDYFATHSNCFWRTKVIMIFDCV